MITISILLEDDALVAINKPAGVVVNRAEQAKECTVQDWIIDRYHIPEPTSESSDFLSRSGIVHRIDKETSGILLIAKTEEAFSLLQSQFFSRSVSKTYYALTHGIISPSEGTIQAPVGRLPWNRRKFGVIPDGRDALTTYRVMSSVSTSLGVYSLVTLSPKTGRTHQIRIHLKHIGHPIVSDALYVGKHVYEKDIQWCSRMFLHACALSFCHPTSREAVSLQAPLPYELVEAWQRCGGHDTIE